MAKASQKRDRDHAIQKAVSRHSAKPVFLSKFMHIWHFRTRHSLPVLQLAPVCVHLSLISTHTPAHQLPIPSLAPQNLYLPFTRSALLNCLPHPCCNDPAFLSYYPARLVFLPLPALLNFYLPVPAPFLDLVACCDCLPLAEPCCNQQPRKLCFYLTFSVCRLCFLVLTLFYWASADCVCVTIQTNYFPNLPESPSLSFRPSLLPLTLWIHQKLWCLPYVVLLYGFRKFFCFLN